jgi:signal transduction histidine kinase
MELGSIAIVGAGMGGYQFLKVLLNTANVRIRYVCDIDPNAKGVFLAKQNNIKFVTRLAEIVADPEIDLIFESTGRPEVFEELTRTKLPSVSLVGSVGTRAIFSLLDSYNEVNRSLQSYKINLERRIIERTEELEKLNAELANEKTATELLYEQQREANAEKSKYLIHTTHQLKAPFAAIQNYVDIMLDGYTGGLNSETRDVVAKIGARCELLSATIRDMLELAKLKAHVLDLVREELDLRQVTHDVIERFAVAATAKRLRVTLREPPEQLTVRTVRKQLFELLATLLENAVKYSREGGTIEVTLDVAKDGKRVVSIADHGIGIPAENLPKIFAEYFRSNNAASFDPNGNGLGLTIAKEIANQLDLGIDVESVVNQGTTFHVRI